MDKTEVNIAIGAAIRCQRLALGIAQRTLAERIGVSYQQVQKYETAKDGVSVWRLMLIAKALRIPVLSLLPQMSGELSPLRHRKALLVMARFQQLNPDQQDQVAGLLKAMVADRSTHPN